MWEYNYSNELYHYGVKGMKWGVRKDKYVTVRQAVKNAKKAGKQARKESLAADKENLKGQLGGWRKAVKNGSKAYKQAQKESFARDNAYNKELRNKNKSEDYLRARELQKKPVSQLSNSELRELNTRMQLETQYRDLNKKNVSSGEKFIKDVAYETAKNTVSDYGRKYAKKGIEYILSANSK